jgi:transposase-like protein
VVAELEEGRFQSIEAAKKHYGIGGSTTVQKWLKRYGKNHLQAKVVRVETPDEADQIRRLKAEIKRLEQALGQTQAQKILEEQYLKLACEELGQEVEKFKKNAAGRPSTEQSKEDS